MRANRLILAVDGLRNDRGHVLAALYDHEEGFPNDRESSRRTAKVAIAAGQAAIVWEDVEAGVYAVGVLHDENDNGEMDKNMIGIPKEGFAISGYDEFKLEMPKFEKAAFEYAGGEQTVHVKMHYLL